MSFIIAGPFWICTTLVFTTAIAGNMANYIQHSGQQYTWKYDFHKGIIFILLNLYFIVCSYSTNFNMFLVLINFHIAHLFLSLDFRMILILLTMFA